MEQLEVLPHLGPDNLAKFAPMMLSRAFLECYIAGFLKSNYPLNTFFLLLGFLLASTYDLFFVLQEILNVVKLNQ